MLLITYYFPPYTGIEGNRLHALAASLHRAGIRVTVLTRQWRKNAQSRWEDYYEEYFEKNEAVDIVDENYKVIRLPYKWSTHFRKIQKGSFKAFYYWYHKLNGKLHPETDTFSAFFDYAKALVKTEQIDWVLVSSPPLNMVRLGYELQRSCGVPFIADFRDSFNNKNLSDSYKPTVKEYANDLIARKYLRKWLKNSTGIMSVSKPVIDTIGPDLKKPLILVKNGYEEGLFNSIPLANPSNQFSVSVIGNLYPSMDISFMARGIQLFLERNDPDDFLLRFVGLKSKKEVVTVIRKYIDDKYLVFQDRVDRSEALRIMRSSSILLQVGWRDYKGFCPGKVFEYMAAGKNILIAPADGDLTDKIIKETNTGFSANTVDEVAGFLELKYKEWKSTGSISYSGDPDKIREYTRENQNRHLVDFLFNYSANKVKVS